MNYKKFRDIVVEEDSIEPKQMHRFLLKVALFCLFTSMSLALLTSTILSSGVAWVIMVIGGITFISILDYVAEDKGVLEKAMNLSKFWWLSIVAFAVIILVLKLLYFI